MFGKSKLEMRLVKDKSLNDEHVEVDIPTDEIVRIVQESTSAIVTGAVIIITTIFVTRTLEHIIIRALN